MRRTDGSPATKLRDGYLRSVSPDGNWVCCRDSPNTNFVLVPTAEGEEMAVLIDNLESKTGAVVGWINVWTPATHQLRAVSPEGVSGAVLPDPRAERFLAQINGQ